MSAVLRTKVKPGSERSLGVHDQLGSLRIVQVILLHVYISYKNLVAKGVLCTEALLDLKGMDQKLELGKVCVTGASGFLASWLIKRLLLSGYHVTGTVRDPGNQKKLAHLWRLEGARERLRLVKADLMEEGSFDDAILGCHGVFHSASPVLKPSSDPKACLNMLYTEILEPAVEGTLNVLRSCKKNPSLRRVVLTSSSSAVRVRPDGDFDSNIPLDESSWSSVELCETLQLQSKAKQCRTIMIYSRTLVKLHICLWYAAWDFCKENGIDLVTVLPSFVIGPCLPPDLCSTASDVLGLLKAGETEKFKWHGRMGYVHIDDVALCHISVYEHESAHGRYLCSSTVLDNNELASLLSKQYPSLPIPKRFEQLGRPRYDLNTSKLKSLGFKFKTIQEMFDDCIASLVEQVVCLSCLSNFIYFHGGLLVSITNKLYVSLWLISEDKRFDKRTEIQVRDQTADSHFAMYLLIEAKAQTINCFSSTTRFQNLESSNQRAECKAGSETTTFSLSQKLKLFPNNYTISKSMRRGSKSIPGSTTTVAGAAEKAVGKLETLEVELCIIYYLIVRSEHSFKLHRISLVNRDQENLDQRINMELVVQEWHGTSALLPDLPNSNHS
ncbi:unnamed protein product [Prunus brigantina]